MQLPRIILMAVTMLSAFFVAAEPWYYDKIRTKFIDAAVKHRTAQVTPQEAQDVSAKIINIALKTPQLQPVFKELSSDYLSSFGGNIQPAQVLRVTEMTNNAYYEMRQNPNFANYLQYIKSNYHKFDFTSTTQQDSRAKGKAIGFYESVKNTPDGQRSIAIAKKLAQQVAVDAKIPVDQLPEQIRPPPSSEPQTEQYNTPETSPEGGQAPQQSVVQTFVQPSQPAETEAETQGQTQPQPAAETTAQPAGTAAPQPAGTAAPQPAAASQPVVSQPMNTVVPIASSANPEQEQQPQQQQPQAQLTTTTSVESANGSLSTKTETVTVSSFITTDVSSIIPAPCITYVTVTKTFYAPRVHYATDAN